jgi:coatomer subunit beta
MFPLPSVTSLIMPYVGEDALANLSIEKVEGTRQIQGHVRIRSKTQGIALSLGDKITVGRFTHMPW